MIIFRNIETQAKFKYKMVFQNNKIPNNKQMNQMLCRTNKTFKKTIKTQTSKQRNNLKMRKLRKTNSRKKSTWIQKSKFLECLLKDHNSKRQICLVLIKIRNHQIRKCSKLLLKHLCKVLWNKNLSHDFNLRDLNQWRK